MSAHRGVRGAVAWRFVTLAAIALSCGPTQELEPSGIQPGCGINYAKASLTAGHDPSKKPKKAKKPHPLGKKSCDTATETKIGLLVMYDTALLEQNNTTEAMVEQWIRDRIQESNQLFANSGAGMIKYEPITIRKVSARLPNTQRLGDNEFRVRTKDILDDWVGGKLPVLTHLRNAYGADLAVFVTTPYEDRLRPTQTARTGVDTCGVATLPTLNDKDEEVHFDYSGRAFNGEAFAVIEYRCGASSADRNDFTFAHELGHTLGLHHDDSEKVLTERMLRAVRNYAFGAKLDIRSPDNLHRGTVMGCGDVNPEVDGPNGPQVPLGVCNRIPHFSNPDKDYAYVPPGCSQPACEVVTGSSTRNNASVVCERAEEYAKFREPDGDAPPTVIIRSIKKFAPDGTLEDAGAEVASGTRVVFEAVATDPEDGDLTSRIQWLDPQGQIIPGEGGTPPGTLRVELLQPWAFAVSARVADKSGQVDEWVAPLRVTWPEDEYEDDEKSPQSAGGHADILFNAHQVRNFHVPGDVDKLRTGTVTGGQQVRVRLVSFGARAAPRMDVILWSGSLSQYTIGSGITDEVTYTVPQEVSGSVRATITNPGDVAGIRTDYSVHLELIEPQSVFPMAGGWYNPERSGHGIDFQLLPNGEYAALWYTYDSEGNPLWYIADPAPIEGKHWRSRLRASTWNGSANTLKLVGNLELSFASAETATLSWSFPGTEILRGSEPFIFGRFDPGGIGVANGTWYPPGESGWGASLWHQGNVGVITAYTYDKDGKPTWAQGTANGDPRSAWEFGSLYQKKAPGLCPSCPGGASETLPDMGTARFSLTDAERGRLTIDLTYKATTGSWRRSNVDFRRLTKAP